MKTERSEAMFARALELIPGGVNSPVRAFRGVGGTPRFIARGEGAYVWDVDGNRYLDYVLSWGPLILGHAHPVVVEALREAIGRGTSYGAPTEMESELAQLVIDTVPSIEMIRFVNSGTEATMSALRLARAYTGREKIVKFAGGYHGHADMLLTQAGSGVATLGLPDSPGVPAGTAADTLTADYNDLDGMHRLFEENRDRIAAVIVEPIAANMGFVMPEDSGCGPKDPEPPPNLPLGGGGVSRIHVPEIPELPPSLPLEGGGVTHARGFLHGLQDLCREHGALFVLDEVMTGFRVAPGGAQAAWGLDPDITCLGKVIGGGLPVGAYAGKREIMQMVAPAGPMYQAGTLSGNPLAMTAGLATIRTLLQPGVFEGIADRTRELIEGIRAMGLPIQANYAGTMFGFYFLKDPNAVIRDYPSAKAYADVDRYKRFFHAMLEAGFYFAPSQFEAGFMSAAHTAEDVRETLKAIMNYEL